MPAPVKKYKFKVDYDAESMRQQNGDDGIAYGSEEEEECSAAEVQSLPSSSTTPETRQLSTTNHHHSMIASSSQVDVATTPELVS